MNTNLDKVKLLARDLRDGKQFPRSPRTTLGGYVVAARAVDKCRALFPSPPNSSRIRPRNWAFLLKNPKIGPNSR